LSSVLAEPPSAFAAPGRILAQCGSADIEAAPAEEAFFNVKSAADGSPLHWPQTILYPYHLPLVTKFPKRSYWTSGQWSGRPTLSITLLSDRSANLASLERVRPEAIISQVVVATVWKFVIWVPLLNIFYMA